MKNRIEAEQYIEKTMKGKDTIKPEVDLGKIKFKKTVVNHTKTADEIAKLVCSVPMPKLSREVILYKLANPGISNTQIAIMAGIRATDVFMFETEGKSRIKAWLERNTTQDAIDKANCDQSILNEVRNLKEKSVPGGAHKLN